MSRILVVDDNELGLEMTTALLEADGLQVSAAKNGKQAVEMVTRDRFDLVLMDIQMPVMDGISATRAIRALDDVWARQVPIIAMTANAFAADRQNSFAAGMNGHIVKPIEREILLAELKQWLPIDIAGPADVRNGASEGQEACLYTALPQVDVRAGIRRVAGDQDKYLQLLKKFQRQFAETAAELRRELASGHAEAAILRVHTLKGVAGNLGADKLFVAAGRLEQQLKDRQEPLSLEEMLSDLSTLLVSLQRLPEIRKDHGPSDAVGTETELRDLLAQFIEPLQKLQAVPSQNCLRRLLEKQWPESYTEWISELESLIADFRLGEAADKINRLLTDSGLE